MGAGRRRVSRVRSAGRTRFQLTPDSVRGERMRKYAPQGGAAVDAVQECVGGGAPRRICVDACTPRRCRGVTESETARAVRLRHCCERRGRCYVGALETRYYGSGASESVEGEVRRADPFSVNPGQRPGREDEEICTARRCRCRCSAGVRRRRRSAAHLRRCVYPPTLSGGVTESETARAVMLCLWSSGVPPARRQQGRVKTRHVALRSAYRVTAECRRSATMSADVGGDGARR